MKKIDIDRVRKDLLSDRINRNYSGIPFPNATRKCGDPDCKGNHKFMEELGTDADFEINKVSQSLSDLTTLFHSVMEDYQIKANMRLQRILFSLAILGILLTIYGTNTEWVNGWIEYFLAKLGGKIPRP